MNKRYIKLAETDKSEEKIVSETNDEGRKMKRKKYDVLLSLSTILTAAQKGVDSTDIHRLLSNELAACGFDSIVLTIGEKAVKVANLSLPSHVTESVEKFLGTPLQEREFNAEALPHYGELMEEHVVFSSCEEVFPQVLGVPLPSLHEIYAPRSVVLIPILQHDCIVVVASDSITEEELPVFCVFKELIEAAISNVKLLEEMKEQKEFSERIIKSVQEGIMLEDAEGVITFVNPTIQQMLQYTEAELVGHPYSKIACPEYIELAAEETKKRPKGIQSQYEVCVMRKDGTRVPVIVSATPLFDKGEYVGTLTVFTDISAQKKAEEEIRSLKEFSENIIQSMHEAVIIEDEKGVITFVNPKMEELLERKEEEIVGYHWREFIAPEYLQKVEEESARRVHGISGQYETALLTKSTRRVPIMVGSTPLFEHDRFKGVISVCVDLTVVKEKEKEIQQKNEDLQLLSKINHALNKGKDLKTILDLAVQEVQTIFDSDAVAIMFVGEDNQHIRSEPFAVSPEVRSILTGEPARTQISYTMGKGGILEKTVKKRESYLVQEDQFKEIFKGILTPEIMTEIQEKTKVKSAAVLPLVVEDEVIGVIVTGSRRVLDQNDLTRLKSLSRHLGLAIHHARLDETLEKTSQELQTSLSEQILLRELLEKLYVAEDQKEVVTIATEGLRNLEYSYFGVWLKENDWLTLEQIHAENDVIARVTKIIEEATGKAPALERIPLDGESIYKVVHEKGKAVVTDNVTLHEEKDVITVPLAAFIHHWTDADMTLEDRVLQELQVQSAVCIPIHVERELAGIFVVGSEGILRYHDFVVLETVGQIISEALGKIQYAAVLEKKKQDLEFSNRQLSLLQEINNALNTTMDLGKILKILVRGINSVFGYDTPSVYLLSEDGEHLIVKEFDINSKLLDGIIKLVGFSVENYRIPLFEGSLLKQALATGEPLITGDIPRLLRDYTDNENLRRLAGALYRLSKPGNVNWITALPLVAGEESVGMLVFGSKKKVEQEDIDALSGFLNQTALAIAKARMYEELKEASQMKSEFIDIASHELRTPLTSIMLYLEMIQMGRYGELTPELEEKIGLLQASSERLQEIIDQTLVSSRILKQKLELKKDEISLVELVKDVKAQLRPLWEAKKQTINIDGPYKFPLVKADRDAIWKVVTALLDNAIKYSQEESRITVKLYDLPKEVEVAVMDEGMGIQQEYLNKIFDEFFIIPSETEYARMDGRTGLGLFIAKGIVEEHGGRIWVESVYGLGSTFHFTLPK